MRGTVRVLLAWLAAASPTAAMEQASAAAATGRASAMTVASGRRGRAGAKEAPLDVMGLADWGVAPPSDLEGLGVADAAFPDEALPAPAQAAPVAAKPPLARSAWKGGGDADADSIGENRAFRAHASLISAARGQAAKPKKPPPAPTGSAVVEEYDTLSDDDGTDPTVVTGKEAETEEDIVRERIGDVRHVVAKPKVPRAKAPRRPPRLAAAQQAAASGWGRGAAATATAAAAVQAPAGGGQMQAQCMSYANFLKTQDIAGTELVRMWVGTCQPAVMAGAADPAFQMMCDSLGGAVSPFVNQPNWSPEEACAAVLRVFNEAGIGA